MVKTASNIVDKKHLRDVQKWTLESLAKSVQNSAGPFGSTTQIITDNAFTEYTKDGHSIIRSIKFNSAIENSIQQEITELTRHIVNAVGDGTTSAVMLSNEIFKKLCDIEDSMDVPPYKIIESFKKVTSLINEKIYSNKRDLTLRDVYDIAMICTNSDKMISSAISDIYKQYGLDVYINLGTSFSGDTYVNSYDGLTLNAGYADTAYINRVSKDKEENGGQQGCAEIHNPRIYAFLDPVDTPEMVDIFEKIVFTNILAPYYELNETKNASALEKVIPTVIIAPKFSRDVSSSFEAIETFMYQYKPDRDKPPLLIINSTGGDLESYTDMLRICGCSPIKKYMDPKLQQRDIETGKAVTVENILEKYGSCEMVRSTALKTTFINPRDMYERDENGNIVLDENGERKFHKQYTTLLNFLEEELSKVREENGDANEVGNLRRRISSLKANTVDYLIGGLTVTDRDSAKALADDAIKNIRSAALKGVGYGANFEGLRASISVYRSRDINYLDRTIAETIVNAYQQVSEYLYKSAGYNTADVEKSVNEKGCPINLVTGEFDKSVLSTIDSDPTILDAISKIITIMFTTNQSLVQTPNHNIYCPFGDEDDNE